MLIDQFSRIHNYLRISLTEACNLACSYCMPDNDFATASKWKMSSDEIYQLAKIFVELGTTKIRLTGGEPLLRKDAGNIISNLAQLKNTGLKELAITTNGIFVDRFINEFIEAGINSVNVSLDTLIPERFAKISKRDFFHKVMSNIHLLLQHRFHVKVNMVVMHGVNDDEIVDFVNLTREFPMHIRFIEFMPFDGNHWNKKQVTTFQSMMDQLHHYFEIIPLQNEKHDTAKAFKVLGFEGTFAFISTMSEPFCSDCNRMRLTADGKMKNCLFSKGEMDLLTALRKGDDVKALISQTILEKHFSRGGQFDQLIPEDGSHIQNRSMIKIGG